MDGRKCEGKEIKKMKSTIFSFSLIPFFYVAKTHVLYAVKHTQE